MSLPITSGLSQLFIISILPVAGKLLNFTLSKITRIPLYLRLLWKIYQGSEPDSEARKDLTSVFLVLGSILTFMAYSYVPFTGVPIIGAFTTPVAAMIAIVVSLIALDTVFALNQNYWVNQYPEETESVASDINALSQAIGPSNWEKMVKNTQALLDNVKQTIDPNQNYDDTIVALSNSLMAYLYDPATDSSLTPQEVHQRIITEGLPPVAKLGGSIGEGSVAGAVIGAGTHGLASTLFTQASLLTSIKGMFGVASGIAVSASAYSLLTLAAPVGLAAITGLGVADGVKRLRDKGEKKKLSAFWADILIATLPMVWVDGDFSAEERDVFNKLLLYFQINEKDTQRLQKAMEQHMSLDTIVYAGILKEDNPQKARIKHCWLLEITSELAKADGIISSDELALHNQMANLVNFSQAETLEIRRLNLLRSGINIQDRISVMVGDITEQSVDVIVNSTNINLLPGRKLGWLPLPGNAKNVDAAIHKVAGEALKQECQSLNGCQEGEAKITRGYHLPCNWIIHTVSPIWQGNKYDEEILALCYRNSLQLAHQKSLDTIALPALGTGVGKFPLDTAAQIAMTEIQKFLNTHFRVKEIKIVCGDELIYQVYQEALKNIIGSFKAERLQPLMPSRLALPLS